MQKLKMDGGESGANLLKLKAKPKPRRILVQGEDIRLLQACRESQSHYLYSIVLMGLTTGQKK